MSPAAAGTPPPEPAPTLDELLGPHVKDARYLCGARSHEPVTVTHSNGGTRAVTLRCSREVDANGRHLPKGGLSLREHWDAICCYVFHRWPPEMGPAHPKSRDVSSCAADGHSWPCDIELIRRAIADQCAEDRA